MNFYPLVYINLKFSVFNASTVKAGLPSLLTVFLLSATAVYSISFVLPKVVAEFGAAAAFAVPLSWVGGAVGGVALSVFGDAWSRRYALLASILLFTLPLGLNIRMMNLIELLAAWFLIGFGVNGDNGLSYVYATELASPRRRGFVGSVMQGLYYVGGIVDLILAAYAHSLQIYFLILFLAGLVCLPLWFLIPESGERIPNRPKNLFLRDARLIRITVFGSLFAVGSFLFLVPLVSLSYTYLSGLGLPAYKVLLVALGMGLVGFAVSGRISDRFGRRHTTYLFAGLSTAFSVIFFLNITPFVDEASIIALTLGSSFFAYFGVWMSEVYPAEIRATGTNTALFLGRLLGGGFGVSIVLLLPFSLGRSLSLALTVSSILVLASATQLPETVNRKSDEARTRTT